MTRAPVPLLSCLLALGLATGALGARPAAATGHPPGPHRPAVAAIAPTLPGDDLPLRPGFASDQPSAAPAPPAARPAPPVALPLPGPFPAVELRTLLVAVHLVGLCFGLGGSTLLYFWIFRWMRWGALPAEIVRTFDFVAKSVAVGLGLLWLSGVGFLLTYADWDPGKLANPKIWAKLVIVTALSLNGILVHRRVSPFVRAGAGAPLLARETRGRRRLFVASGALSGTSWYAAFALGLLHEFNGGVPATTILVAWALAVAAVYVALSLGLSLSLRGAPGARPGLGRAQAGAAPRA